MSNRVYRYAFGQGGASQALPSDQQLPTTQGGIVLPARRRGGLFPVAISYAQGVSFAPTGPEYLKEHPVAFLSKAKASTLLSMLVPSGASDIDPATDLSATLTAVGTGTIQPGKGKHAISPFLGIKVATPRDQGPLSVDVTLKFGTPGSIFAAAVATNAYQNTYRLDVDAGKGLTANSDFAAVAALFMLNAGNDPKLVPALVAQPLDAPVDVATMRTNLGTNGPFAFSSAKLEAIVAGGSFPTGSSITFELITPDHRNYDRILQSFMEMQAFIANQGV